MPASAGYYDFLDFNAPLSGWRADAIARALAANRPRTVLDVGCGWAELLLRTVAGAPGSTGRGVDTDERALARGGNNAAGRGLADRVSFVEAGAASVRDPADVVICIGADHAFGDQRSALRQLSALTVPGGRLLFGTGYWQRPPTTDQAASVGLAPESLTDLAGLVELAMAEGFRPLHTQTANRDEWEQFESGFLADWEEWLLGNADHPEAGDVRARSDKHRTEWLHGWRHVLGFAYLTLGRPSST